MIINSYKDLALILIIFLALVILTSCNAISNLQSTPDDAKQEESKQQDNENEVNDNEPKVPKIVGTYKYEKVINNEAVQRILDSALTKEEKDIFVRNMNVKTPIGYNSGYVTLDGCRARYCNEERAFITMNRQADILGYIFDKGEFIFFRNINGTEETLKSKNFEEFSADYIYFPNHFTKEVRYLQSKWQ